MKRFYKIFAAVAMVMAMAACGDEPLPGITPPPASDKLVKIEAVPAGDFTKATDTAFEVGDQVSVFGYKSADLAVWLDNGKFTKQQSGFASDQEYYWYEGEEESVLVGLYPYNADITTAGIVAAGVEFSVKSDQSTHKGYTASDLMAAVKRGVTPTEESVTLKFDHLLSKVVIDINNQTSEAISEVYLDGVRGNLSWSLTADAVAEGGVGTIKAGKLATASEGYTDTYVLIIPPQTVAPQLAITSANQEQYTYNAAEGVEFGVGKVRHLTVTITEESISTEFDAIVNDWSADEDVEFSQQGGNGGEEVPTMKLVTIAEVLALGTGATIGESMVVEGVVISNVALNNLTSKKGLYIQDPTAGVQFYLEANHSLAFGDQVQIDLKGATIGQYNDAIQITGVTLDKITTLSSGNIVEPRFVSIEDFLANKYESQYVAIEGVQVVETDLAKTWVMGGSHTSITMEDAGGNNFLVFSSKYATYGAQTVAQGSGVIMGIAGYNKGNVQLIFAQESDIAGLTNARLGDVVGDMTINPLWSVELVPEYYEEETGTTYNDLIRVVSTDEENGFFVEFFDETYYNTAIKPDIKGYVNQRAAGLVEQLNNYNAENNAEFNMLNFRNYHFGPFDQLNVLNPGRVVVAMWGMTIEGEVTGLYYISDVLEVRDPATPEYKAWLGTYKIVGSDDQGQAVTSMITVSRSVVNESYWIEGWNGIGNAIIADFEPTGGEFGNGAIVLYPQTILEDTYVGETHLTKIFFGGIALLEGGYMLFETEDIQIGQAQWLFEDDNSWAGILPYTYQNAEGVAIRASQVGFFGVLDNGDIVGVTNQVHTFREDAGLTMIRQNPEEQSASMVARKRNLFEDEGNNGIARRISKVRRVNQTIGNYVVGGKKFNAINF